MEVHPMIGAGSLRFGMTRQEVRAMLGDPDSRKLEEFVDGTTSDDWTYDDLRAELSFQDDENWRLGSFNLERASIHGVDPIGMPEDRALRALHDVGVPPIVLEDDFDGASYRNYECEEYGLSMWVSDGVVTSVTLLPRFDPSGNEVLWPDGSSP